MESHLKRIRLRSGSVLPCAFLCASIAWPQQRTGPPDSPVASPGNPLIREGDSQYVRRQEKRVGSVADKGAIAAAVRAYDTASEAADSIEARWKLARSLAFQGAYTDVDQSARQAISEKARRVSEDAIGHLEKRARRAGGKEFDFQYPAEVAETVRKDSDAPPVFYWAAMAWGQWALLRDKNEATKLGAADKIRAYATVLAVLDPTFEDGGAYRLLGRLHDLAPRIQYETEWVSRNEALRNLRLAVATDPSNFANRLFLAEALARGSAEDRAEAVRIAEVLVKEAPSPTRLVEELRLQEEAAQNLQSWRTR